MADPSVQGAFFPHAVFFQLGHYMIGYYLAFIRYINIWLYLIVVLFMDVFGQQVTFTLIRGPKILP